MRHLLRVLALALALPVFAAGCGGTTPADSVDDGGAAGDLGSNLALFAPCTENSQCQSMLCTQESYDRSPTPICTYKCDANLMNPLCTMGCNPKGFCKKPN